MQDVDAAYFGRALPLVLGVVLIVSACGPKRYTRVHTVTDVGQGQFWVAGSEGFAAFFDGSRFQPRHYPRDDDAPDWAYRHESSAPAARVVLNEGKALLFSHVGDVMVWHTSQQRWERLPVKLSPDRPHRQLNLVIPTPDDKLLIQLHSDLLLWTSLTDLRANRPPKREQTPTYFTWMGYMDRWLVGLGWDNTGNRRAIRRRDPSGRWPTLAVVPTSKETLHMKGLLMLGDGSLGVVHLGGMARTPKQLLGAHITPDTKRPLVHTLEHDPWTDEAVSSRLMYISGVANVPRRGAWILGGNGVAEIGKTNQAHWSCPPHDGSNDSAAVDAIPTRGGVRLVTPKGAVWDLIDGECKAVHSAFIRED